MNKPSEMQDWFDGLLPSAAKGRLMSGREINNMYHERPINPPECTKGPVTRFFASWLDFGSLGNQPINVVYNQYGRQVEIISISWFGTAITKHLSESMLEELGQDILESIDP